MTVLALSLLKKVMNVLSVPFYCADYFRLHSDKKIMYDRVVSIDIKRLKNVKLMLLRFR